MSFLVPSMHLHCVCMISASESAGSLCAAVVGSFVHCSIVTGRRVRVCTKATSNALRLPSPRFLVTVRNAKSSATLSFHIKLRQRQMTLTTRTNGKTPYYKITYITSGYMCCTNMFVPKLTNKSAF